MALESDADGEVFNVGTGRGRTVCEVAESIGHALGKPRLHEITGRYRAGDIRHCVADVSRARSQLGFEAEASFEEGIAELVEWLRQQEAHDGTEHAAAELERRGLTV